MHLFQVMLCFDAHRGVWVCVWWGWRRRRRWWGMKAKGRRDKRNVWKEDETKQEQDWLTSHNHIWSVKNAFIKTMVVHEHASSTPLCGGQHRRSWIQITSFNGVVFRWRFNHKAECRHSNGRLSGRVVHLNNTCIWEGAHGKRVVEDWRTTDA